MAYLLLSSANFGGGVPDRPAATQALEKARALSKNATEKERLQIEAEYAYQNEGNKDRYSALIKEYAVKYPKEKEAHAALGFIYMYIDKKPEKAIEELNIALSLDPNFGSPLNLLGYLYMGRKEFAKALEYFQRQTTAAPENPNAYDALAECYFRTGKVEEAKATLQRLIEKSPNAQFDAPQYINALEENYAEAFRLWDKALEAAPVQERRDVYWRRGVLPRLARGLERVPERP